MKYKNLPNQLTFLRILLAVLCIYFILQNTLIYLYIAFAIFVVASLTDYLDGVIAKKYNLVTDFGKLLDPIADKILIIGIFLAFLQISILNVWVIMVIIMREFIITGIRLIALNKKMVLAAEIHGKHKMVSQVVAILITFIILILYFMHPEHPWVMWLYQYFIDILMLYVLAITLFSGIYYLWSNRKIVKNL